MHQLRETEKSGSSAVTARAQVPITRSLAPKNRRAPADKTAADAKAKQWLTENKAAIAVHNAFMEKYGCCGDAFRGF